MLCPQIGERTGILTRFLRSQLLARGLVRRDQRRFVSLEALVVRMATRNFVSIGRVRGQSGAQQPRLPHSAVHAVVPWPQTHTRISSTSGAWWSGQVWFVSWASWVAVRFLRVHEARLGNTCSSTKAGAQLGQIRMITMHTCASLSRTHRATFRAERFTFLSDRFLDKHESKIWSCPSTHVLLVGHLEADQGMVSYPTIPCDILQPVAGSPVP